MEKELDATLQQMRWENVPYFRRNVLPHPIEIKNYFINLISLVKTIETPHPENIGVSVFSQTDEDGILLWIFAQIGFMSRKSVEIGCNLDNSSVGIPEGNTMNLISNFNFHGLIVDMDSNSVASLSHFFRSSISTRQFHNSDSIAKSTGKPAYSPTIIENEVTPENINELLLDSGFEGEIDVLSIDVDGIDFELFSSLSVSSPRVLIIEINNRIPFESSIYLNDSTNMPEQTYRPQNGSSLTKIVNLANQKGYTFLCMNNSLLNAFFIRNDVVKDLSFKPIEPSYYFEHRLRSPESKLHR